MISNQKLIHFLKGRFVKADFIDKLKITYRPYICPFDDLLNLIQKDEKIVDVGCGSGQFSLLIAEFTAAKSIYGIDIKPHLIENAKQLSKGYEQKLPIHFEVYNGINFPNEISECSTIFLVDVFHHIPSVQHFSFLSELFLSMKKGTKLIIKDIDGDSPFVYFNKLHDLIFSRELVNEISLPKLRSMTEEIGFKTLAENYRRMYVYPHYTLIMEK